MFVVKICSGSVNCGLAAFKEENQAIDFCERENWRWFDENEFEWDLWIDEDDDIYIDDSLREE